LALHRSVAGIELAPGESARSALAVARRDAGQPDSGWVAWAQDKFRRGREAWAGLSRIAARPGSLVSKESERFVGEFMTDALVLYLVKLHWPMIVAQWLKRPWQYRYEWLSTLYLIYTQNRHKLNIQSPLSLRERVRVRAFKKFNLWRHKVYLLARSKKPK
jgi:hypothetical protein